MLYIISVGFGVCNGRGRTFNLRGYFNYKTKGKADTSAKMIDGFPVDVTAEVSLLTPTDVDEPGPGGPLGPGGPVGDGGPEKPQFEIQLSN